MKKRTTASTILLSLAAVTGCNSGDSNYVSYKQTPTSDFEEGQKHQVEPTQNTATNNDVQVTEPTDPTPPNAGIAESADAATKSADPEAGSVKPASHSVNSDTNDSSDSAAVNSIVSAQSGLAGRADIPEIDNATSDSVNKIELLIPQKLFRRERGTDAVRISYDDIDLLKVLNMDPVPADAVNYFPEWLSGLNGKKIRIRGWMYPTFVPEGLTSFTLARDNGICCFQRFPKIYDVILVQLEKGRSTDYIGQRPFDVEGVFRIDNEGDGSDLPRLYKIENARVLD